MVREIKRNRLIKNYISKLKKQNNSLTWVIYDDTPPIRHNLFMYNKYEQKLYIYRQRILDEFGVDDDEIIKILINHFKLSKYIKEDDKGNEIT